MSKFEVFLQFYFLNQLDYFSKCLILCILNIFHVRFRSITAIFDNFAINKCLAETRNLQPSRCYLTVPLLGLLLVVLVARFRGLPLENGDEEAVTEVGLGIHSDAFLAKLEAYQTPALPLGQNVDEFEVGLVLFHGLSDDLFVLLFMHGARGVSDLLHRRKGSQRVVQKFELDRG